MSKISLVCSFLALIGCSLLPQDKPENFRYKDKEFSLELKSDGTFYLRENKVYGTYWNGRAALENDSVILTFCKKYSCDNVTISLNQDSITTKNSINENQYSLLIEGVMQFEPWFFILQVSTDSIHYQTVSSGYGNSELKSIVFGIENDEIARNILLKSILFGTENDEIPRNMFFKFRISEMESNDCIKSAEFNSSAIDKSILNKGLFLDLSGDYIDNEVCDKIYAQFVNNRKAIVLDSNCAIDKDVILSIVK